MRDYEQTFEEFWRPILTRNGRISMDQIKRELHDYHTAIGEVSIVYDQLTNGRFSKPNTASGHVIDAHDEVCGRLHAELFAEDILELIPTSHNQIRHASPAAMRAALTAVLQLVRQRKRPEAPPA